MYIFPSPLLASCSMYWKSSYIQYIFLSLLLFFLLLPVFHCISNGNRKWYPTIGRHSWEHSFPVVPRRLKGPKFNLFSLIFSSDILTWIASPWLSGSDDWKILTIDRRGRFLLLGPSYREGMTMDWEWIFIPFYFSSIGKLLPILWLHNYRPLDLNFPMQWEHQRLFQEN